MWFFSTEQVTSFSPASALLIFCSKCLKRWISLQHIFVRVLETAKFCQIAKVVIFGIVQIETLDYNLVCFRGCLCVGILATDK